VNKHDRLRQKKEKRRRDRRQARRQQEDRHIDNIIQYPQFIIEEPDPAIVPKELVEGIRLAVQAIKFNDRKQFSEEEAQMFKLIKQVGFHRAIAHYSQDDEEVKMAMSSHAFIKPGNLLFDVLQGCGEVFDQYIPSCDIRLVPAKDIHIRFDALLRAKGPYGTIYYSRHQPTIQIQGKSFIVGYSRHAMIRVAERATLITPAIKQFACGVSFHAAA
jgi:hypothetical protein